MTNKEALIAVVQVSVDDNTLVKALLDQDASDSENYTTANSSLINKAAIDVLEGLLSRPDVSEGGFSESFDRGAIEKRLDRLYQKEGLTNPRTPIVRNASNRW
jgi:hypothetical protein